MEYLQKYSDHIVLGIQFLFEINEITGRNLQVLVLFYSSQLMCYNDRMRQLTLLY